MSKFDTIRPFYDSEVHDVLKEWRNHPTMKTLLQFSFPDTSEKEISNILLGCNSIHDFQTDVIYYTIRNILRKSCEGFTISGFEKLQPDTSYLFFSNHRDIVLDTSLLNYTLFKNNLVMTASAIGDNLVQEPFLSVLARLTRNFLIQRKLSPKEMLISSKLVSQYICHNVVRENRSVWIAQREGRTKNGDDKTQPGVLKMLALAAKSGQTIAYFKSLKIVPVSISYELDPTDALKLPELIANHHDRTYTKADGEDLNTIVEGVMGPKKRIHIAAGAILDKELDEIAVMGTLNQQFQALAEKIDHKICKNYKLWPSNYIAYDMLHKTYMYRDRYSETAKREFQERMETRIVERSELAVTNFLMMYANPVAKKLKHHV